MTLYKIGGLLTRPVAGLLATVLLLLAITGLLMPVFAESEASYKKRPLDVRVDRLERLMSSQKQLELLYRMKQLQEENQQLRSLLEEQTNEIRLLNQQQRELYTDLDQRLSRMESGAPMAVPNTALSAKKEPSAEKMPESDVDSAKKEAVSKKDDLPVVLDKSSYEQAKYGVIERQEITLSHDKTEPAVEQRPVYKKQILSNKQRQDEKNIYQKAYDELRARQYNKARESFVGVIEKYPGGHYAHIAQYWVAESSYAQGNYEQAIIDYQLLLDVYPLSPKKAEAELKKAHSFYELGNKERARQTLNHLLLNYPDTTEAGQAKRLLKQL